MKRTARIAAVLVAVAVVAGCAGQATSPSGPPPSLPGTAGHFDNGEFSFDYPADWPVIAADRESGGVEYVFAVIGDGTWQDGCLQTGNTLSCGADKLDVPAGGIVVKIYRWWGGPMVPCRGRHAGERDLRRTRSEAEGRRGDECLGDPGSRQRIWTIEQCLR